MTIRDLRALLFSIENQEMTIKELRQVLFEIQEQDTPISKMGFLNGFFIR